MSQTIDVNVLLYASNTAAPEHDRATQLLPRLAEGPEIVVLLWPTIMGYLRIATHPAIFERPLSHAAAVANVESLLGRPQVRVAAEGDRFWDSYRDVASDVEPRGNAVPDAHLVGLMLEHGIGTLWTRDRDFRRYEGLTIRDPFA